MILQSETLRRIGRSLLDAIFPLYSIGSTPERRRYWRGLSFGRSAKLFAGIFFILSGAGFFVDLLAPGAHPLWSVLLFAFALGILNIVVMLIQLRRPKLLVIPTLMIFALYFAFSSIQQGAVALPEIARRRIILDASCLFTAMMLGYRLFLSFVITQGLGYVRLQTELAFAHEIQTTLVPTVLYRDRGIEAYGCSIPSDQVGGDLVDVVASDRSVVAYVADVSGHGIPAGVLMGNVKTAMRQGVLFEQSLPVLLDGVNRVLPSVKQPNMYVTFAGLHFDGSNEVEFIVAGHPPILHYRRSNDDLTHCAMEQFPVGLFAATRYMSRRVDWGPGDLFAIATDGLVETTDSQDEEFGLERLGRVIAKHAGRPLPEIYAVALKEVSNHGAQRDDRTLLLVRMPG
ncbi:MAG: serine/threonine-protein phosphatase [Acidobacteriota bacterium]|nr:serine/threonine-protein phosphatase [Acidobacteriota bacterium]